MPGNRPALTRPVKLRLSLGCDLGEVRAGTRVVRGFLAEHNWPEEDLKSLELVLVEACNNAVKYAGETGTMQPIELETVSDPGQVEFRLHDHTPGFDWPERIELPPPESETGRGLYLISLLMDYAAYFRGRGENILVLRKNRTANEATPPGTILPGQDQLAIRLAENERIINEMVDELSSCYESLSAIFRYSTEQGKSANLNEFARRILSDLVQIVGAEWFVFRLVPKGESQLVVFAASEPDLQLEPLVFPTGADAGASVELEAAFTRQRIWFDVQRPLPAADSLRRVKAAASGIAHPILLGDQLMGTLTIGKSSAAAAEGRAGRLVFTAGQANVINTFAEFLAIQIANARFQEEQFHRRLVSRELEIANNIQRSLLLSSLPQLPGFTLAASCRNAREIGGDFYDVIRVNGRSLLLVVADVMGKGIPAAMFAAMLRTLLRAAPELTSRPGALLERVNRLLFPELSGVDMFITAQLAFVDADARRIVAASAGHCPLAVATAGRVETFSPEGMPLGILPDTAFHEETVPLPEGCLVLLYTDGLTEAINPQKRYFGQQRLLDWLQQAARARPAAERLKEDLVLELDSHRANAPLHDDQTFLMMASD